MSWEPSFWPRSRVNPVLLPDGTKCRLWRAGELGDEVYYGVNVEELLKRKQRTVQPTPWKPTSKALRRPIIVLGRNEPIRNIKDALGIPRGFRARVFINQRDELQILGCGQRVATIQLRGNKVLLHHSGNTATMKRPAFKAFIAHNKTARARQQAYLRSLRPSAEIIPFRPKIERAAA